MAARAKKYWLTTHWPHPKDGSIPWYLYLNPDHPKPDVQAGDGVLFYETKGGPPPALCDPRHPCPPGREGLVAIAEVGGPWRKRTPLTKQDTKTLEAVCVYHKYDGFLPRLVVCKVMGWSESYYLHGLGGGSGIMSVKVEQFNAASSKFFLAAK